MDTNQNLQIPPNENAQQEQFIKNQPSIKPIHKVLWVSLILIIIFAAFFGYIYINRNKAPQISQSKEDFHTDGVVLKKHFDTLHKFSIVYPEGATINTPLSLTDIGFSFPIDVFGLKSNYGETYHMSIFTDWPYGDNQTSVCNDPKAPFSTISPVMLGGNTVYYDEKGTIAAYSPSSNSRTYIVKTPQKECFLVNADITLTTPDWVLKETPVEKGLQDLKKIQDTAHTEQFYKWFTENILANLKYLETKTLITSGVGSYQIGDIYSFTPGSLSAMKYVNSQVYESGDGQHDNYLSPQGYFVSISFVYYPLIGTSTHTDYTDTLVNVQNFAKSKNATDQKVTDSVIDGVSGKNISYKYYDAANGGALTTNTTIAQVGDVQFQIDLNTKDSLWKKDSVDELNKKIIGSIKFLVK